MRCKELSRCSSCDAQIEGPVFMLNDRPYCCQRHRLQAFQKAVHGSESLPPLAPIGAVGLRASFSSWC